MSGSETRAGNAVANDMGTDNTRPLTQVAAAVLLRPAPRRSGEFEYLLAQRPVGKVYAGYWEFPGGKLEAGETAAQALVRELQEELGIHCRTVLPWLSQYYDYPHARVHIRFFRIPAWDGVIAPLEHSGFAWVPCDSTPTVAPVLPANTPIVRGLALPVRYAITCAELHGVEPEMSRLARALEQGLKLIQLRDKRLPPDERERFARRVLAQAHAAGARVLINDVPEVAARLGADGVHLSSAQLAACAAVGTRPPLPLVGASCHDAAQLAQAEALACDFAVLAPVLPTATHPATPALGWDRFGELVAPCRLPVFALGGMRPGLLDLAMQHGAHGVAMMRGW